MDVQAKNKLIAEFMKMSHIIHQTFKIYVWQFDEDGEWYPDESLNFHSSWDWLLPVVEKIWVICNNRISLFYFEIEQETIPNNLSENLGESNIADCWYAVTEFIQWYNTQK
jgi:hypothetical protein